MSTIDAAWASSEISSVVLIFRAAKKTCCPSTNVMPSLANAASTGISMMSTPIGSFWRLNWDRTSLIFSATVPARSAPGGMAPRNVEMPARAPS